MFFLPATVFWSCQIYIFHIYLNLIVLYIFAHIPDLHTRRIMMNHVDLHDLRCNLSDEKKHGGFRSHGGTFPRNHPFSFDVPCNRNHPAIGGSPMTSETSTLHVARCESPWAPVTSRTLTSRP